METKPRPWKTLRNPTPWLFSRLPTQLLTLNPKNPPPPKINRFSKSNPVVSSTEVSQRLSLSGFRVYDLGFRVLGFRVLGLRVLGIGV